MRRGRQAQTIKMGDMNVEVLLDEADHRTVGSASVWDLEEILQALQKDNPVDVWDIRRKMKWMMKKCYKKTGMCPQNPWWMPRR